MKNSNYDDKSSAEQLEQAKTLTQTGKKEDAEEAIRLIHLSGCYTEDLEDKEKIEEFTKAIEEITGKPRKFGPIEVKEGDSIISAARKIIKGE